MVSRRGLTRAFSKRFRKAQRAQRLAGIRDARYITHARDDRANFLHDTRPKGMGKAWDAGFKRAYTSHHVVAYQRAWASRPAGTTGKSAKWKGLPHSRTGEFQPRVALPGSMTFASGGRWSMRGYDPAKHPRDWMGRFRRK